MLRHERHMLQAAVDLGLAGGFLPVDTLAERLDSGEHRESGGRSELLPCDRGLSVNFACVVAAR
jgi:hypothetical protein